MNQRQHRRLEAIPSDRSTPFEMSQAQFTPFRFCFDPFCWKLPLQITQFLHKYIRFCEFIFLQFCEAHC